MMFQDQDRDYPLSCVIVSVQGQQGNALISTFQQSENRGGSFLLPMWQRFGFMPHFPEFTGYVMQRESKEIQKGFKVKVQDYLLFFCYR